MRSHRAMYGGLVATFPSLNVVSEEHEESEATGALKTLNDEVERLIATDVEVSAADVDVWIDPLDATQEYTENLLHFVTTMVCVAVRGKPAIGVIHKPFAQETIWAWNYAGAKVSIFVPLRSSKGEKFVFIKLKSSISTLEFSRY